MVSPGRPPPVRSDESVVVGKQVRDEQVDLWEMIFSLRICLLH